MPGRTVKQREELKKERSDKCKKLLHEKGDSMNKAEKAFVGTFVEKPKNSSK